FATDPHGRPVDIAAQLVNIAQPGQILLDEAYRTWMSDREFEAPNGDPIYFVPQPAASKKFKGSRDKVSVSAACWRNRRLDQIRNLPLLRVELERMDADLAEVLQWKGYILNEPQDDLDGDQPANAVTLIRERLEDLISEGTTKGRLVIGPM